MYAGIAELADAKRRILRLGSSIIPVFLSGKIAVITLTRAKDDDRPVESLREELRKAVASLPLAESWHIEAVSILDDAILEKSAQTYQNQLG
jgi:hypothetical protein